MKLRQYFQSFRSFCSSSPRLLGVYLSLITGICLIISEPLSSHGLNVACEYEMPLINWDFEYLDVEAFLILFPPFLLARSSLAIKIVLFLEAPFMALIICAEMIPILMKHFDCVTGGLAEPDANFLFGLLILEPFFMGFIYVLVAIDIAIFLLKALIKVLKAREDSAL